MAVVYQHRRADSDEVFYVGIGVDSGRAYEKSNRNRYWHNVVNKCGYNVTITHTNIIWEEACSIEKYLISFYGRKDLEEGILVNMTDGGEGVPGMRHSEKTKGIISNQTRTKERIAISLENLKKANTPEAKKKRYENIDYSFLSTPEHIAKRAGKIDYKAIAAKIDYSKVDWRKMFTPEGNRNRALALSIPIQQYTKDGIFISEWESAKMAAVTLRIDYTSINKCCRDKRPSAGGFVWKYKKDI